MKIIVEPSVLRDAVAWAARALPGKPPAPVLTGMLLDASGQELTLSVFDYEVSARAAVPADVAGAGRVLLPGRVLAEIVKSLPDRPVEVALDGTEVTMRCGRAEFGLQTMPVEDYPSLPKMPAAVGSVGADELHRAVDQVAVAASPDPALPMLSGLRLEAGSEAITLVATDRYRMAARVLPWQAELSEPVALVAPAQTLAGLVKGLSGTAVLGMDEGRLLSLDTGPRAVTVRLLDSEYPKWRNLFPEDDAYTATAHLPSGEFAAAVKRVALVAVRNTPVRLGFAGGQVKIQAGSQDTGRGVEVLDCEHEGDIEIAFQPRFLADAVDACEAETVTLRMTGPTSPAVITPHGDSTGHYRHLVMPIRLAA